jgi:hypothetical protein
MLKALVPAIPTAGYEPSAPHQSLVVAVHELVSKHPVPLPPKRWAATCSTFLRVMT